jgi:hypothetical protein
MQQQKLEKEFDWEEDTTPPVALCLPNQHRLIFVVPSAKFWFRKITFPVHENEAAYFNLGASFKILGTTN